jgi:hypothetical protein
MTRFDEAPQSTGSEVQCCQGLAGSNIKSPLTTMGCLWKRVLNFKKVIDRSVINGHFLGR